MFVMCFSHCPMQLLVPVDTHLPSFQSVREQALCRHSLGPTLPCDRHREPWSSTEASWLLVCCSPQPHLDTRPLLTQSRSWFGSCVCPVRLGIGEGKAGSALPSRPEAPQRHRVSPELQAPIAHVED
uniref:Uncharacterized protein n=1 Tax=Pipistrellus kuhlii TaxID=59472 RepID=A0A7J8A8W1_PIPKU|nr:hypothetical protein mPipKuh1_009038 [Pipistrellus kuhlii]